MNTKKIRNSKQNVAQQGLHMTNNIIPFGVMVGSERKLYDEKSAAHMRMLDYASAFQELDIIIFTTQKHNLSKDVIHVSPNIRLHATNSLHKFLYDFDAKLVGRRIFSKRSIEQNNNTIVTVQDPFEAGLVGLSFKKKFKTKLHVQIHGDFLNPNFLVENKLNSIRRKIAEKVIPRANCIRVVSKRIATSIGKHFNLSFEPFILPIYTDVEKIYAHKSSFNLHDKYPQFDFIALMLSRLEAVKGVETAIKSFELVMGSKPNAGLIIVGDGEKRKELEELVKKLNLSDKVIFEGWQDDVLSYLKTADIFLNTSIYEGYCLSLVEAAASKCPIITTPVGVVGESLNESNIYICPVGDEKCFARKILSGALNKDILLSLSNKAYGAIRGKALSKEEFLEKYSNSFKWCYE